MNRRSLILSAAAALAMPAVIRTQGLLMPVRKMLRPWPTLASLAGVKFLNEIDRACMDALWFGTGAWEQSITGLRHIPLDQVADEIRALIA